LNGVDEVTVISDSVVAVRGPPTGTRIAWSPKELAPLATAQSMVSAPPAVCGATLKMAVTR
jgi:hypothetical protein